MEDNPAGTISENGSYTYNRDGSADDYEQVISDVKGIVGAIGLSLTVVYVFCSLVRKNHVAPIFIIDLLTSDLIQFCCMIGDVATFEYLPIKPFISVIHSYSLIVSVGFMVCIALERYLVIVWPVWYHKRTTKTFGWVCVVVWALPIIIFVIGYVFGSFMGSYRSPVIILGVFFLLPLPLFIFFLGGTLKALSAAISVPSDEKRQIVGVLVLVPLLYTLLFLPTIVLLLQQEKQDDLKYMSVIFLLLSPLADLFLYVFMTKGMTDKLLVLFQDGQ